MFTPQQLSEIGFTKAVFGGYDMASVHDVLDPLVEDYTTLYKENAVLKSKMRVLVGKLEEYRNSSADEAAKAQKQAQEIIQNARMQAEQMLANAEAAPAVDVEQALSKQRASLEEAKKAAEVFLQSVTEQIAQCTAESKPKARTKGRSTAKKDSEAVAPRTTKSRNAVSRPVKQETPPEEIPAEVIPPVVQEAPAHIISEPTIQVPVFEPQDISVEEVPVPMFKEDSDEIAREIEQNLEKLMSEESEPKPTPRPVSKPLPSFHPDSITARFGDLQFGRNYNPKE